MQNRKRVKPVPKLEFYQEGLDTVSGGWRWRLMSANGHDNLANPGQGYVKSKAHARRNAVSVYKALGQALGLA